MVLLRSADLVWKSLKNTLSHGTSSISSLWSATSFLAVFWQVCPCSRPDSGSSEAHENKQLIKTLLSNYSMFKKTRNYSAILGLGQYFILLIIFIHSQLIGPSFSSQQILFLAVIFIKLFSWSIFKYRKWLDRVSTYFTKIYRHFHDLDCFVLCAIFKLCFVIKIILSDHYCS